MSLAVTYASLLADVGYFLGYGRDPEKWDADQKANVEMAVVTGYRQFLTPPAAPGKQASYHWTFLKPSLDINLVADVRDYMLPEGFQYFEGDLHHVTNTDSFWAIQRRAVGDILQLRSEAGGTITGRPTYAAVRPLPANGVNPQRFELLIYPTPNDSYTLRGLAKVGPPALSDVNQHPYGGDAHAETLRQACLAAAERDIDDAPQGNHQAEYGKQLAASIDADARLRPSNLGYAGDGPQGVSWRDAQSAVYATWNGVTYKG